MIQSALFWSGGKDSALCLDTVLQSGTYEVCFLVTTISAEYHRISMHGIREELLDQQASSIDIPLKKMYVHGSTNEDYETSLSQTFQQLKESGIHHIIFGDIFLEEIRAYREKLLAVHQLKGVFPLWKMNSMELFQKFLDRNFKAITCCVDAKVLNEFFSGVELNNAFLQRLPNGVDPCGENGEYHSFVYDGPTFRKEIKFSIGEKIFRPLEIKTAGSKPAVVGFWYTDLIPEIL